MKRILILLLVLAMMLSCLSMLAGCAYYGDDDDDWDDEDEYENDENDDADNQGDINNGPESSEYNNDWFGPGIDNDYTENEPTINLGFGNYKVSEYSAFSEGKAIIKLAENADTNIFHCIDKNGNVLFKATVQSDNIVSCVNGFHNGLAVFGETPYNWIECKILNDEGETLDPSCVGGTSFMYNNTYGDGVKKMFEDGYLLVKKTTSTAEGTIDEYAVVNHKMQIVVDYSRQFGELITEEFYFTNIYVDGYLIRHAYDDYYNDCYYALNIKTGERLGKYNTLEDFCADTNVKIERESDFWMENSDSDGYINLDGDLVINLSEYSETLQEKGVFKDGYAMISFVEHEDSSDARYSVTVIDDAGNFMFEPIEIEGRIDRIYNAGDGKFLVSSNGYFATFNKHGKKAQTEKGAVALYGVEIGEDIILTAPGLGEGFYQLECYTFDLQKK